MGGYAAFNDKICGDEVQIFGDFYYDGVNSTTNWRLLRRTILSRPGSPLWPFRRT